MPARPEISFVIPVYDKADILPYALRALAAQQLPVAAEYIFVDDASRDASAQVIAQQGAGLPGLQLVRNTQNAGPSIRLNQGAARATGRLLCLIDADELIVPDGAATMLRLLCDSQADMVHGKVVKSHEPAATIALPPIGPAPRHSVSDTPLRTVLTGRGFVRMAWLVDAALFRSAGGCDERLFIQDEALPLRLAIKARRLVDLQAGVTHAPAAQSHLSADKRQQHHDRFMAYYNLLQDHPELDAATRKLIIKACISTAWKAARRSGLSTTDTSLRLAYLRSKLGLGVAPTVLSSVAAAFHRLPDIRHPQKQPAS